MKEELINLWRSRTFQIGIDVCRILLLVIAVLIFYKLVTEIEIVKQINDPIKYFETKTNSTCQCYINSNSLNKAVIYPKINWCEVNKLIVNSS